MLNPDSRHKNDPKDPLLDLSGAIGPGHQVLADAAYAKIDKAFADEVLLRRWEKLDQESLQFLSDKFTDFVRLEVLEDDTLPDGTTVEVRIRDGAKDDSYYYLLVCLPTSNGLSTYFHDAEGNYVELLPGCVSSYFVQIPRYAIDDLEPEPTEQDKDLLYELLIDQASLALEVQRFHQRDFAGVIGALLLQNLDTCGLEPDSTFENIGEVTLAKTSLLQSHCHQFHIVITEDQTCGYLFEICSSPADLRLDVVRLAPVSGSNLAQATGIAEDLTDADARERILKALDERGLIPFDCSPEERARRSVKWQAEIAEIFEAWTPEFEYQVLVNEIFKPKPGGDESCLVIEVVLKTEDEKYLLPNFCGPKSVVSHQPVYLYFGTSGDSEDEFDYSLELVGLGPQSGIGPVVSAFMKEPEASIISPMVSRAIESELGGTSKSGLGVSIERCVHLPCNEDPELESGISSEELATREVAILVSHSQGTSIVAFLPDQAGILDLSADIAVPHFYEKSLLK